MKSPFLKRSRSGSQIDLSRALKPPTQIIQLPDVRQRGADERGAPREPAWCVCNIYSQNVLLREAVILDISETGLRLRWRARGVLPRHVTIKASRIGLHRVARVVWQDTYTAGLQFMQQAEPKRQVPETLRK